MLRVAFLGLGAMGAPMARRILSAGFPLAVWNRSAGKAAPFASAGARVAKTPRETASGADVVATMLADPRAVDAAARGNDGLLAGLAAGATWIDFSTVAPADSLRFAGWARERGAAFCDVPVAGSVPAATDGKLGLLAGGDAAVLDKVRPVLDAVGSRLLHVGGVGQGSALKLANNVMFGVSLAGFGEALALAVRLGVPQERAADWLLGSSPYLRVKYDYFLATGGTPAQFTAALMRKDFDLARGASATELPAAEGAARDFERTVAAGLGEGDVTSLLAFLLPERRV